ncbi:hypothetical protein [Pseudomonas sp. COR18]|uniref:hypothetical protein n=1 Tax=Pseudomonas sp. COR18 TaxID=3399680 RepID=UPI003AFF8858
MSGASARAVSLAVLLAGVFAFLNNVSGVMSYFKGFIPRNEPLAVIQARLSPVFRHPKVRRGREEASLSLQVRNYSEAPITLISASLYLEDSQVVSVGKGGGMGGCTLSPVANENNPIVIASGGTEWFTISKHVDLRGVSLHLADKKLSGLYVHDLDGEPFSIAELQYVDELNDFFAKAYGREARIKVITKSISGDEHIFIFTSQKVKTFFRRMEACITIGLLPIGRTGGREDP